MKYEEHSTEDQTLVAEFLLNLQKRFRLQLDLLAEWEAMEVGEIKEWQLWRTHERTLVVTTLWMKRTERCTLRPVEWIKGRTHTSFITLK